MKKIIRGKLCDTDKAELIHHIESLVDQYGNYDKVSYYKTKKGNYFTIAQRCNKMNDNPTFETWALYEEKELFEIYCNESSWREVIEKHFSHLIEEA